MTQRPLNPDTSQDIPDPEAVYARSGEEGLRDRLQGLDREALERVVQTYPPHHTSPPALEALSDKELVGYIVDGAERGVEEG